MKPFFPATAAPRLFGLPPGADFAAELARGVVSRCDRADPLALARVTIWTNTRRSARAIEAAFAAHTPTLLPRILVVADLARDYPPPGLSVGETPALERQLALARLVSSLLAANPGLAPVPARFGLARSLAGLADELCEEGVDPDLLGTLDTGGFASHWQTSQQFLSILAAHPAVLAADSPARRNRFAAEALAARWAVDPPQEPVLIAGSTGSRGSTFVLMKAAAALPQGAVVLPGFDFRLPGSDWHHLGPGDAQSRFARLLDWAGIGPAAVARWSEVATGVSARNRLISLAMCPAPTTGKWVAEGPALAPLLGAATEGLSLVEAGSPDAEAAAVALALRRAAAEGKTAALVTPSLDLARRVTARLTRWGLRPDNSAGTPMPQTAPGTFLRLTAQLRGDAVQPHVLAAVLRHPLCGGQGRARALHREWTQQLENGFLRGGAPTVSATVAVRWARDLSPPDPERDRWADWLFRALELTLPQHDDLQTLALRHHGLATHLSRGWLEDPPALWDLEQGQRAAVTMNEVASHARGFGKVAVHEYTMLLESALGDAGEVRDAAFLPHPGIAIWGTLEARTQTADVTILGGLNEGTWPAAAASEPWLNRAMRASLGLPSPEQRIGLSAHDFQQAAAAAEVIFSRCKHDGQAPTVASRWLTRIENLLAGQGNEGQILLAAMRSRGEALTSMAAGLDQPGDRNTTPAPRPAPSPPVAARPQRLSVTAIETLIKDPYAIYARYILKLRKRDPFGREPDAMAHGNVLHRVLAAFSEGSRHSLPDEALLLRCADTIFTQDLPWPEIRAMWRAQLQRSAARIVATERDLRGRAAPALTEAEGKVIVPSGDGFTLTAKADRIDIADDGSVWLYDYKSGAAPDAAAIDAWAKQLLLEAAMAERGGFAALGSKTVAGLEYLPAGTNDKRQPIGADLIEPTWQGLLALLATYADPATPYAARIRNGLIRFESDYDQLSRLGEWVDGESFAPVAVPG